MKVKGSLLALSFQDIYCLHTTRQNQGNQQSLIPLAKPWRQQRKTAVVLVGVLAVGRKRKPLRELAACSSHHAPRHRPQGSRFTLSPLCSRYDAAKYGAVNQRFVNGTPTLEEAQSRWKITCDWREAERIDGLLQEPQPHFHDVKAQYPHAYHNVRDAAPGCG